MAVQGAERVPPPSRPALAVFGVLAFLLPLAIVAGYALPGPAALVAPAALEPVEDLIKVEGVPARAEGHLYLASLRLTSEPRLGQYLLARLQPDVQVVPRAEVQPTSLDPAESQRLSQQLLLESQRIAEVVALRKVGMAVELGDAKVLVVSTLPGTPAEVAMQAGDVIEAVDGETIQTTAELVSIVRGHLKGELLSLSVRRQGCPRMVTLPAAHGPLDTEGPVLGLVAVTQGLDGQAPLSIQIDSGRLAGGPAAGLMYALGIYNAVASEDITRGHKIAGSGTLRPNGEVGPVDAIALKARGAEEAGAEYFLAPAADAAAARAVAREMKVIPVRTFDEALSALADIGREDGPEMHVVPAGGDTTLACLPR